MKVAGLPSTADLGGAAVSLVVVQADLFKARLSEGTVCTAIEKTVMFISQYVANTLCAIKSSFY